MDERTYLPPPDVGSDFSLTKEKIKDARRNFSRSFLFIFVYLVSSSVLIYAIATAILIIFGLNTGFAIIDSIAFSWIMQLIAAYMVAFPLSYLVVKRVPYIKRKRSKLSLEEFVVIFFICQGIMTFGAMISNALTSFLSSLLGYTVNNETSDLMMDTPIWIVILIAVIIGPLFEELMFRKIFMDRMSAYGDRFAILVSAISFGIFHGNFSQLIYATGLGLVLGYVYSKTRNVMYSFLLHALINFFGSIPVMLISDNLDRVQAVADPSTLPFEEQIAYIFDASTVSGVVFSQYLIAFIGIVLFVYVLAKRLIKVPNRCEIALPKRVLLKSLLLNVGAILYVLVVTFEFIFSILP